MNVIPITPAAKEHDAMLDFLNDAPRCCGNCEQGDRACDCARCDEIAGMQMLVYALIALCAVGAVLVGVFGLPLLPWGTR